VSRRARGGAPRRAVCAAAVLGAAYCWHRMHDPGHLVGLAALAALMLAASLVLVTGAACLRGCAPALVPCAWRIRYRRGRPRPALPAWLRRAVLAADRHRCVYCGSRADLQVDHVRPWASGGLTALFNLAVLCRAHNRVKSNYWRDPDGYVHYRPFAGAADMAGAASILRAECRRRRSPLRWLRVAWAAW
jgi:hypothetical protein